MTPQTLREALRSSLVNDLVAHSTHKTLAGRLTDLGMAEPSPTGTKFERVEAAFNAVPDSDLSQLAENYLKRYPLAATTRNHLQDLVWAGRSYPEIPKRIRRELAQTLTPPFFQDYDEFIALLDHLWVLDNDPLSFFSGNNQNSLRGQIEQHVVRNPEDWSGETLFNELGAFVASNRRFALFIEGLASAEVLPDEPAQRAFVQNANVTLHRCGVELRETASSGGYPVFKIVALTGSPSRKPKNLIFASPIKPDIRLSNAVDNDIEVISNGDSVLIYEEPIGDGGLTWKDLQTWWSTTRKITDPSEAKRTLYLRLKDSLPSTSPPQKWFFEAYHRCFSRDILALPALLPEVWLHWDHKTVQERGADALLRFRMDFLMLLPNRVRVVLEIDGKQHYADADGRADPNRYAKMVLADREKRLAGYEIYRFGASELGSEASARAVANEFFQALFDRHHVAYSSPNTGTTAGV